MPPISMLRRPLRPPARHRPTLRHAALRGALWAALSALPLAAAPPPARPPVKPPAKAPAKAPAAAAAAQDSASAEAPPEVKRAIELAQKGDLTAAIALLEPVALKPQVHPFLPTLLGTLYLQAQRPAEALATLLPVAEGERAGPVVLFNAARAALALEKDDVAERLLIRALQQAPGSAAARELGLVRGKQGRTEEAYALLLPWVRANPEDAEARTAAAYCAVELSRVGEAQELVAGLPEGDPRTQLLRGRSRLIGQDPRGALPLLTPLTTAGSSNLALQARRYAAVAHLAIGESREAAELLQGKTGDDPSLGVLLAKAQLQAGEVAAAAATLEPFARTLPPAEAPPEERGVAAEVALESGRALVAGGRFAEALPRLERATRWAPEKAEGWQLLGQAQMGSGRREEATASLGRFRERTQAAQRVSQQVDQEDADRRDPTGKTLREARALAAQGKADEALARLRRESALVPDDPRPRSAEIELLVAAGRREEAIGVLQGWLAKHPEDGETAARWKDLKGKP